MILVTGSTGHLGGLTIDALLSKGVPASEITALVRDEKKAAHLSDKKINLRIGDYFDYSSLVAAFKGVDTLLLVSSASMENRVSQHENAIKAAKENGVKHIIYTSMLKASDKSKFLVASDHFHTEAILKESGVPFTILRNTFYLEILPMLLGDSLKSGVWYYAAGNAKANFVLRNDIAEALANVIKNPVLHQNKTYEITSGNSYSFEEIASFLSEVSDKKITYHAITNEALVDAVRQAGTPEPYIGLIASIAAAFEDGELDVTDSSLELLLGRKPTDLKAFLPNLLK